MICIPCCAFTLVCIVENSGSTSRDVGALWHVLYLHLFVLQIFLYMCNTLCIEIVAVQLSQSNVVKLGLFIFCKIYKNTKLKNVPNPLIGQPLTQSLAT